jgi:hypothetical protein
MPITDSLAFVHPETLGSDKYSGTIADGCAGSSILFNQLLS